MISYTTAILWIFIACMINGAILSLLHAKSDLKDFKEGIKAGEKIERKTILHAIDKFGIEAAYKILLEEEKEDEC